MPSKEVNAKWVGPYAAQLTDGTVLVPGETTVTISRDEAKESDNWEPTGGKPAKESDS